MTVASNWDIIVDDIQRVRERRDRTAAILEAADIAYAVVGGNAVAEWVARQNVGGVRFTRNVDILIRRDDLEAARDAMEAGGFQFRHVRHVDMFLDAPGSSARDAVHLIYADEKVTPGHTLPAPSVEQSVPSEGFRVIDLRPLVTMKLDAFRRKDQMHLLDMIGVGLIDPAWADELPTLLADRLRELLDEAGDEFDA